MTKDSSFTIRPASGPFKSPKEIVQFYYNFDGWQEVLPKTDNTYSPGSKYYKYEVSPGIPLIPNMSRLPLKSYEKTPLKHDVSEDQSSHIINSSHIKKKLFTTTTYKHFKKTDHNETETEIGETSFTTQRKAVTLVKYVSHSIQTIIKFIISYFISISTLSEVHKSVMEIGSNIINTTIRKITNWVHLASITLVHYELVIITTMQKIIYHYFGHTRKNNLIFILISALIIFLAVGVLNYLTPLEIPVWRDSWTHFLLSPFINILNLVISIYQVLSSTVHFVLDLVTVVLASMMVALKLFGQLFFNVFRNINTVVDSATKVHTIPVEQNQEFLAFDYNLLARKIIASEEFQHVLINKLNISQSNLVKLHDQEFQYLLKNQLEKLNSENLNWINNQLKNQKITLNNVKNDIAERDTETIKSMEKKISELQNIVSNLINSFEDYKSKPAIIKPSTESMSKEACSKNDWNSIVNFIEQYVNITMKSTLSIYDADKTGMVDYALESAGATVLGTRCTQTKPSTAALTMFGIPLWFISNGPRMAIQPGVNPGQCWAFIGAKGFLVLKLSKTIHVTGFTIEHLPKSLSEDGHIRSAPKDFSVWGLKHETDSDGKLLGKYQFTVDGPSLQYFSATATDNVYSIVELRIESNHGHEEYTCLYRIRVHGDLAVV
ncbi:uncharacterized protein LOC111043061 [Myzus persicae]|uniref:uncharacterized protein LOC111043061 n=1 Tax=Myzus persicae TaxID=13164 RepID=UPI000B932232|nr:uncharacterized protein LOC111043061 [Myzus persicae]XP_022183547.1 uncharacterized protein LOC111043061 [Myzus persicae]